MQNCQLPWKQYRLNIKTMRYCLRQIAPILLFIATVMLYNGCANIVAPTGGPEDEEPPVMIRSTPPNFTTNYQGQDVRMFFDEFVELKDLRQNLLISPPLENDPEMRLRGRSIIMSVSDELLPNTTYNFFFGESVVDITEGNPIPNFQFVVSTGDYVDSLSVKGKLVNAFTLQPEEGVFVMLYDSIFDSVPLLQRPVYLSKTNEQGEFRINNMREGEFLIFALRDLNSNYIYDNPDEEIAFLDSLITPYYIEERRPPVSSDTINSQDSIPPAEDELPLIQQTDTLSISDTVVDTVAPGRGYPSFELFLFQEADTVQRIVAANLLSEGKVNIEFRIPAQEVTIREYNEPFDTLWYIPEFSANRDSLTLWMPDVQRDTLRLEISDRGFVIDSVTISLVQRPLRGRAAEEQEDEEATPLLIVNTPGLLPGRKQPYYEPFRLRSQTPLETFEPNLLQLYLNDTVPMPSTFEYADSLQRTLAMTTPLEPDSSYRVVGFPGAMTDIFGAINDTLDVSFQVNTEADYATIILNLEMPLEEPKQFILQLLDDKMEEVIQEKIIQEEGIYHFNHLSAGTFRLRLIDDENQNQKWDTGHYLKNQQPERVIIYPEPVQTRLNWEIEVIWPVAL